MNLFDETSMVLSQYNLKPNKKLGQNFMINEQVIDEIVDVANVDNNDVIIEIGPGIGTLTKKLCEKAKKVVAIELDRNMINILNNRIHSENFEIIYGDVLKVDLNEICKNYDSVKVVANLPYYITTPIIMKLLEEKVNVQSIVIMVQKEVGERLCAIENDDEYGAISISVKYYCDASMVIDVPRENFLPAPDVDSCVIKLDVLKEPRVKLKDEKLFFGLIRAGFNQRRKTILNSLSTIGIDKEDLKIILNKLEINEKSRAENLSIFKFADIANSCSNGEEYI